MRKEHCRRLPWKPTDHSIVYKTTIQSSYVSMQVTETGQNFRLPKLNKGGKKKTAGVTWKKQESRCMNVHSQCILETSHTFLGMFPSAVNKAMNVILERRWRVQNVQCASPCFLSRAFSVNRDERSVRAVEGPCKCEWGSLRTMNSITLPCRATANSQRACLTSA